MAILLDSASLDDAAAAAGLGFVRGITRNPALMAKETKEARAASCQSVSVPSLPDCLRTGKTRTRAEISSIVTIAPLSKASPCSNSTRTTCAPSESGKTSCVRT